jgi:hypothetical protein
MLFVHSLLGEILHKTVPTLWLVSFVTLAATSASADIFVVNGGSSSISRIDPDTGVVLNTIPTPVPTGFPADALAFSGTSLFYTRFYISEIYELDPDTGDVRNSFPSPTSVGSLGFGRTSFGPTLFALAEGESTIFLLDPSNGDILDSFAVDPAIYCPISLDVDTATNTLFVGACAVTAPHIFELDATTGAILHSFFVPGVPLGIGFDGGRLFAVSMGWPGNPNITDNIIEIDPSTGNILKSIPTPDASPSALAGSPVPASDIKAVDVDIRPFSRRNFVISKSGFIPVAVLTTPDFDAQDIDEQTVRFGPSGASVWHGVSFLFDVDHDQDLDLVMLFLSRQTGIQCGDTEATLTGETSGNVLFEGSDQIRTIFCQQVRAVEKNQ